jgi:hypothetical protein
MPDLSKFRADTKSLLTLPCREDMIDRLIRNGMRRSVAERVVDSKAVKAIMPEVPK